MELVVGAVADRSCEAVDADDAGVAVDATTDAVRIEAGVDRTAVVRIVRVAGRAVERVTIRDAAAVRSRVCASGGLCVFHVDVFARTSDEQQRNEQERGAGGPTKHARVSSHAGRHVL
jgi:hypothetical protein